LSCARIWGTLGKARLTRIRSAGLAERPAMAGKTRLPVQPEPHGALNGKVGFDDRDLPAESGRRRRRKIGRPPGKSEDGGVGDCRWVVSPKDRERDLPFELFASRLPTLPKNGPVNLERLRGGKIFPIRSQREVIVGSLLFHSHGILGSDSQPGFRVGAMDQALLPVTDRAPAPARSHRGEGLF